MGTKTKLGIVTIGQAPRTDVVPEMADLIGPGAEILERGALDGLAPDAIAALEPRPGQGVLVTRLADGRAVFVAKEAVTPLVQARVDALEAEGVGLTVLLCTGPFVGLRARRALLEPEKVLVGVLRGVAFPGRLGVIAPSPRHVEQTAARWRGHGFDPVVVSLSPYHDVALGDAAACLRDRDVGLLLLDCMGFRREARRELQEALGVPLIVANLLVARVVGELLGA